MPPIAKPAPAPVKAAAPAPAKPAPKVAGAAPIKAAAPAPKPVAAPAKPAVAPKKAPPAKPAPAPAPVEEAPAAEEGVDGEVSTMLEDLEGAWGSAEAKEGGGDLPDGKYQARIDDIAIAPSKASGRRQCTFTLTVVSGDYVNRKAWKRDGLDNEENIGWFKGGLKRLGVEPPTSIQALPALMETLKGTYCEINVRKAKDSDFVNIHFNKALDVSSVVDETGEGTPTDATAENATEAVEEAPAAEATEAATGWEVGNKCQVNFDGTFYAGEITALDGENATVKFDDDQTEREVNIGELASIEGGDDTDAFQITFSEDDISEADRMALDGLARGHGFNPDDYAEWIDVCNEVGQFCGMTGTHDNASEFVAAVPKPAPKKAAKPAPKK